MITAIQLYLNMENMTKYEIEKRTGMSQHTLGAASKKSVYRASVQVIVAIAKALDKTPGNVLNRIIEMEILIDSLKGTDQEQFNGDCDAYFSNGSCMVSGEELHVMQIISALNMWFDLDEEDRMADYDNSFKNIVAAMWENELDYERCNKDGSKFDWANY